MKQDSFIQTNLFDSPEIPKRQRHILSYEEKKLRKEKSEAHTAWKLLKSRKFTDFSERHKFLLQKYYNMII